MLFFQVMLLAGYSYAHALSCLRPKVQVGVHSLLLVASALLLSVSPENVAKPSGLESPVPYILALLFHAVGLPYFLLSTTGPLIQSWHALTRPGQSPYRLYSLSNVGSLGALLSYPLVVEPRWDVEAQTHGWSFLFLIFGIFALSSAAQIWNAPARTLDQRRVAVPVSSQVLWFALAASASVLLLAITNHVCQDIAVIPFLWILPLSLYLLSFILCFESSRWYQRRWFMPSLVVLMLLICDPDFTGPQANMLVAIAVSFSTLFVACMLCHGELALLKPEAAALTRFYLILSAGGAFGGIFVALVAPYIFPAFFELHIALGTIVLCSAAVILRSKREFSRREWAIGFAVLAALALGLTENASRMLSGALVQTRNFYGVLRLTEEDREQPPKHRFVQYHGRILHGFQYVDPQLHQKPNAYFGENTGVGLVLRFTKAANHDRVIGVVGLGVGTLAAYGEAGERIRFYEINPDVIAQTTTYFSYLKESRASVTIIPGDGRLSLEREPDQAFDILVLDAFSGDAVPVHLLTREAFALYLRHLKPGGVVAVNITNSHLDLRPVLAGMAEQYALHSGVVHSERDEEHGYKKCDWMILSATTSVFDEAHLAGVVQERDFDYGGRIVWTDARNNLIRILK